MKNGRRVPLVCLALACVAGLLSGCGRTLPPEEVYIDEITLGEVILEDEAVALAGSPAAIPTDQTPVASGTMTQKNERAAIDYSNSADGYVMVRFPGATKKALKTQVKGPATTYTYNLPQGSEWTTFPLSDGDGGYQVTVFENTTGSKYATVLSASFPVTLKNEFAPFLRPNQYVDYGAAPRSVGKAAELCAGLTEPLDKVARVYDFVLNAMTYDAQFASKVPTGYLPSLDQSLDTGKGICFDYASLMTGMLRSQSVPCKLVVGYAGTAYHAWISVYSEKTGWIEGAIFFDGTSWQRMDPTFASSGKSSEAIMKYIGDGKNYTAKYFY